MNRTTRSRRFAGTAFSGLLAAVLLLGSLDAEAARRLGGGKSSGRQSENVTQRQATPANTPPAQQNQVAPANNAAAQPGRPATPAPAAAAAPKRPWGAMLGGLAAGLGLAWLASSLGLGAGFGNVLLILLLAAAAFFVVRMLMNRRRPAAAQAPASPFAFQGAGAGSATPPVEPRAYNPEKVGNDASARPFERNTMSFQAQSQPAALAGSQTWGIPAGFDTEGFLAAAKRNFVTLQEAWDKGDVATLRGMMTDDMVAEIKGQLAAREAERPGQPNQTDVVMLEARLLGIEQDMDGYLASVEFSGMIREEPAVSPEPFREVWNMSKPAAGNSGWVVAGVQALQ